jgi:Ser/Thr protein kinase RdoA (MazF antagonist)
VSRARWLSQRFGVDTRSVRTLTGPESLNRTWAVEAADGERYVLKVHSGYDGLDAIARRYESLALLADAGLPVPRPLRAGTSAYVLDWDGQAVTLCTWLAGTPLSETTERTVRSLRTARATTALHARLHACAALPRVHTDWPTRLATIRPDHPVRRGVSPGEWRHLVDTVHRDLGLLASARQALIHGDLRPANVVTRRDTYSYLDWDLCQQGPLVLELAAYLLWKVAAPAIGRTVAAVLSPVCTHHEELDLNLRLVRPAMRVAAARDVAISASSDHLRKFAERRLARFRTVDLRTTAADTSASRTWPHH